MTDETRLAVQRLKDAGWVILAQIIEQQYSADEYQLAS